MSVSDVMEKTRLPSLGLSVFVFRYLEFLRNPPRLLMDRLSVRLKLIVATPLE